MERRVALATAGALTSTLLAGTVAFAATTGASILGFGSSPPPAAAPAPQVVTQVQTITDQVVVATPTTLLPADSSTATEPLGPVAGATHEHGRYTTATTLPDAASAGVVPSDTTIATTVPSTKWPTTPIGGATTTVAPAATPTVAATVAPAPAGTSGVAPTATTAAAPSPATTAAAPTTTRPPATTVATTTTVVAATTTTRPPGVPADWPASKPIPPMPPGCTQGQLEDNGVWNCQN